jgi:hypothetical protein
MVDLPIHIFLKALLVTILHRACMTLRSVARIDLRVCLYAYRSTRITLRVLLYSYTRLSTPIALRIYRSTRCALRVRSTERDGESALESEMGYISIESLRERDRERV